MKLKLFILALLVASLPSVYSQVTVGAKAGLNMSKLTDIKHYTLRIDDGSGTFDFPGWEMDYRAGLNAGGYVRYDLSTKFALQGELLYSQQGYKFDIIMADFGGKETKYPIKVRLHYLNVPLLFRYTMPFGLFIEAGPQVGFHLGNNVTIRDGDNNKVDGFKEGSAGINTVDFSVVGGIGYYLTNKFSVVARYNHGFTEATKSWSGLGGNHNRTFQLSLAYDIKTF